MSKDGLAFDLPAKIIEELTSALHARDIEIAELQERLKVLRQIRGMVDFLAKGKSLSFIAPTEFRPTWRLIQTDGDAARTLGEANDPYSCVRQAMENA